MNNTLSAIPLVVDCEVTDIKVLKVPIHTIRLTPFNPSSRTADGARLQKLVDAIRKHGLSYPVLITTDRDLVDGHRRLRACQLLGHTHINCIVTPVERDELFGDVNDTALPMASRGWLQVARGGGKVPARYKAQYDELMRLVGTFGIDTLIRNGLGMNCLGLCKQVCALDGKYNLADIIMAAAARKLSNKLNAVIRSGQSREDKVSEIDAILAQA